MKEIGGTGSRGFSGPSSPLSPYPPVRAARSGYDFTVAASCRILPAVQRGGRLLRSKPVHDQNDIASEKSRARHLYLMNHSRRLGPMQQRAGAPARFSRVRRLPAEFAASANGRVTPRSGIEE